ncbi:MAG: hypothetical protein AAB316_17550, partial [Bacteroidota bacterium]
MLAIVLHASFDILLEMNQTFFMVPFMVLGYSLLDELFTRKENLKAYGYLTGDYSEGHLHDRLWKRLHKQKVTQENA